MESRGKDGGYETFLEHWGTTLVFLTIAALCTVFDFFLNLSGAPWIRLFIAGLVLLISGAGLILFAKIPVYRSRRFFTFGVKSVPEGMTGYYRWGWRIFLIGVAVSLGLLLSRQ